MSIHIFKAILQVKNSFKKRYITIKVKKVLKPVILLSHYLKLKITLNILVALFTTEFVVVEIFT